MNNFKTVLLFLTILLSGCGLYESHTPPADHYYLNPDKDLDTVGRIALVELSNDSAFPRISSQATEALFQALQKKQIFGLAIVRRHDPAWRSFQLDLNTAYTLEQLSAMRKTLNCDAVLVGAVTEFKPYPHMGIGLRLKIVDLTDGQLLWALEQIWDATDRATEERIMDYYSDHDLVGFATLRERLGTVSSLKFVKFVAYETAETLRPERQGGMKLLLSPKKSVNFRKK
ncbi:MAG: hypothetical protein DRP66_00675 [Planctomycetota bacterium]|nr:MAG: hypothetical protein DRP66_00675 [Planctomycetota bacterium]